MKKLFSEILNRVNTRRMMENTDKLTQIELGQTFEHYRRAAEFAAGLAGQAGIGNCEIINFPADGKTVYQDKRMPMAWSATRGRLTIIKSGVPFEDQVVADYQKHPFHLVKGSVSTPPEGTRVRIITEASLFTGEDAANCLVMTNPETRPRPEILKAALDLGALGLVSDNIAGRYETPDGIQWVNACTDGINNHWHVQSEDRPFICFSVSPRTGDKIRAAASSGNLEALAQCDGQRHAGILPAVTALVPGKKKEEFWMMAHLYEPLADDNSAGVVASIEMARVIKELVREGKLPPLEFSLRLVFAMEMYGFAAFAGKMGGDLHGKVIGAVNNDGLPINGRTGMRIHLAPPGKPFFGNYLVEAMAEAYKGENNPAIHEVIEEGMYGDDTFLSDPTTGVPTLWPLHSGKVLWHNSEQKINVISPECFSRYIAFVAAWAASVLTLNRENISGAMETSFRYAKEHLHKEAKLIAGALAGTGFQRGGDVDGEIRAQMLYRLKIEKERMADFSKVAEDPKIDKTLKALDAEAQQLMSGLEEKTGHTTSVPPGIASDKWFEYAATIVPARASRGFPYDQIAVPRAERMRLPDGIIYGPLARILANMDGKKNLQRLIREAEWETKRQFKPQDIKKYITAVSFLSDYGYLTTEFTSSISKADIISALRQIGINEGDLILVHSSLSGLGRVEGGAEAVIDALLAAVGSRGTVLFPAFTHSVIYFEGHVLNRKAYRPYDASDPQQIWTGRIPRILLGRKGVSRSAHPTHSVAGLGPLAFKCLSEHKENDPPACRNSPFGKLMENNGKILYFGTGLAPSTFLHFIEDEMNLKYLASAVCRIKAADGKARTVLVPKHLPGHRDFYVSKAENSKFFRKVISEGLEIREASLGLGKLQVIDAGQLYALGVKAVREDDSIFLCDSPDCGFCFENKRTVAKNKQRADNVQ